MTNSKAVRYFRQFNDFKMLRLYDRVINSHSNQTNRDSARVLESTPARILELINFRWASHTVLTQLVTELSSQQSSGVPPREGHAQSA